MPRSASEIQAEYDGLKAEGGRWWTTPKAAALREELKALDAPDAPEPDATPPAPAPSAPPIVASDDVAFVNDALTQLLLKGKGAGKVEQSYSDVRSLLFVKHILEDAAGLVPAGRISLPHWETLGRERDSGEKFKPGENQAVVDGLAQRAMPASVAPSRPSVTTQDGRPIAFKRSRTLDEPEGAAAFVTTSLGAAE